MLDQSFRAARCGLVLLLASSGSRATAQEPPDTRREVSLADLHKYAVEHAPQLRVAREREQLGSGARAAASALFGENPSLEFAAGPRWGGGDSASYDFAAGISQPLELAGNRGARQRAAQRLDERLDAETALSQFELQIELTSLYRTAQLARAQLQIATNFVEFTNEMRDIVKRRLDAGEATLIELRVAEGDLARAQRDASLARQGLDAAGLRLCELSGWPATSPPLAAAALPSLRRAPAVDHVLDLAVRNHPELRVRRAALTHASAELDVADREGWPSPALGAELSREAGGSARGQWIVLGTLRLPLPLWQRNQAEREQRSANRAVAQAEFDTEAEILAVRIRRAAGDLAAAAERLQLLAASGAAFEDSLTLLRRGLEAGELALLDVSIARERFFTAQVAALSARADYEQAWLELERAAGQPLGDE